MTNTFAFFSHGYPCPPNYNPSDFFIETLSVKPGIEQECLKNVRQICDSFDKSEIADKIKVILITISTCPILCK